SPRSRPRYGVVRDCENWLANNQPRQLIRRTQHWIVPRIKLMVLRLELLRRTPLVRFRRIGAAGAADHRRLPVLLPEARELHRLDHGRDRMLGVALERPRLLLRRQGGEHAAL